MVEATQRQKLKNCAEWSFREAARALWQKDEARAARLMAQATRIMAQMDEVEKQS